MKKLVLKLFIICILISMNAHYASAAIITRTRLGGTDRYETAIEISKEFAKGDTITNCIIGRDDDFADSISVSPFSAYKNAPILLTQKNTLNTQTQARLAAMKIKNVFIIGGTGVVSSAVENKLVSLGYNVTRYGGANRIATNRLLVNAIPKDLWGPDIKVINGEDWVQGMTVALDSKYIKNGQVLYNPLFVVGSSACTPAEFADIFEASSYLNSLYGDVSRIIVDDRIIDNAEKKFGIDYNLFEGYKTAPRGLVSGYKEKTTLANVFNIERFSPLLHSSDTSQLHGALLVRGDNFIDALAVSALAAKKRIPIVMANKSANTVFEWSIDSHNKAQYFTSVYDKVTSVYYVGGKIVLPDRSEKFLAGN